MNTKPKVSVIVPVYNSEKYLTQCLESVCKQTLQEIEIICVDDGSTDSSPEILENFQKKDLRVQIYHQKNLYAGIARNTGKAHAQGEYLVFWDSDDYFFSTALEKMYRKAIEDDADICVCNGEQYFEDKGFQTTGGMYLPKKYMPKECPFNRNTHPLYILNFINAVPWNKMFRRSYIEALNLNFQGVKTGNDVYFVECALAQAERITIVNEALVCYRRNQSAGLVNALPSSPIAPFQAWIAVYDTLLQNNALPRQSFINKILDSVTYILRNMSHDWDAFRTTVNYLKQEAFPYLGITTRFEKEYYYIPWHYDFVQHLLEDTPESFMAYFFHFTYISFTVSSANGQEARMKNAALQKDLKKAQSDIAAEKEKLKKLQEEMGILTKEVEQKASKCTELTNEKEKLQQNNKKLKKKIEEIYNSRSYRIGHALIWLPARIKRHFAKKK